jgi:hypothetical protein
MSGETPHLLIRGPEAHRHLDECHADKAPWGNAFIDERPGEEPPRIISVHQSCHRDGSNHGEDPDHLFLELEWHNAQKAMKKALAELERPKRQ